VITRHITWGRALAFIGGVFFALMLACTIGLAYAHADGSGTDSSQLGVTVSPATQHIAVDPGGTYDGSFTVMNPSATTGVTLRLYAEPFSVQDNDYSTMDFQDNTAYTQIAGWIDFDNSTIQLGPSGQQVVTYHVTAPANATPGGQYACMFAEVEPNPTGGATGQGGATAQTISRVGVLLYGKVNGNAAQSGELQSQTIPFFCTDGSLDTSFAVQNTGNIDFDTQNHLEVSSVFGGTVYDSPSDSSATKNVLPDTTRTVPVSWSNAAIGIYNVTQTVTYLGQVKAATGIAIVAPIWLLILVTALIVIIIAIIIASIVHHRHKKKAAAASVLPRGQGGPGGFGGPEGQGTQGGPGVDAATAKAIADAVNAAIGVNAQPADGRAQVSPQPAPPGGAQQPTPTKPLQVPGAVAAQPGGAPPVQQAAAQAPQQTATPPTQQASAQAPQQTAAQAARQAVRPNYTNHGNDGR
jgi:hypothetical protein